MLPKAQRLTSADFTQFRGSRSSHSPHFILRVVRAGSETVTKVAAVVSTKVAKSAVARNLLRRRIYAVLAGSPTHLRGRLITITAKAGASDLSFAELKSELAALQKSALSG